MTSEAGLLLGGVVEGWAVARECGGRLGCSYSCFLFQVKFIDYFISGLFDAWNSK